MSSTLLGRDAFFNTRSQDPHDTRILIGQQDLSRWQNVLMYGVPFPLVLIAAVVVVRRRLK
jgi:hypothetical protein